MRAVDGPYMPASKAFQLEGKDERMNAYMLVDKQPVRIPEGALDDLEKAWQIENRRVAADVIGHVAVSTVFLVFDYSPGGSARLSCSRLWCSASCQPQLDQYV